MIEITINGKQCSCEKGEFLLQVARRNNIYIPTLCHHEGLSEQGCCRLCLVEVVERGRGKIVVSCVYPVEREIEVYTDNERVRKNRSMVLAFLKQRAPESKEIEAMYKMYQGYQTNRFVTLDHEKCIMCGLCTRACASLGTGAISTVGRGTEKKVSTPFEEPSLACVGCLSCANVCPTKAITFTETSDARSIWDREFELVKCEQCGQIMGTREELDLAAKRAGEEVDTLCSECRKKKLSDVMAEAFGIL